MSILKPKSSKNTPKNFRKTQNNSNLLKTKRILYTDIQAKWGPGFLIYFAR